MSFGTSGAAQLNGLVEANGVLAPNAIQGQNGVAEPKKTTEPIGVVRLKGSSEAGNANAANGGPEQGQFETAMNRDAVEEKLISEAVNLAALNPLRLALYQVTGDEELSSMKVSKQAIRGGAMQDYVLSEEDGEIVKQKAKQFLFGRSSKTKTPFPPSKPEATKLMQIFTGHELIDAEQNLGYEELAFEEFSREVHWDDGKKPSLEKLNAYRVAVIGGGISGVSTAVHLKRLGIPYVGIERQHDIGGTWLLNTYPEARVDTLGFLFQYKFVKGYKWDENFPSGDALRTYLKHVATEYDVEKDFIFGRELVAAEWSDSSSKWTLKLKHEDGFEEVEVNAIISAGGLFATPCLPEIQGITEYKGKMCHTTNWDQSYDYRGKRIAVIGNGSSGAQLMPGLAREAASLAMYQRTPNWIAGFEGYRDKVPEATHWLLSNMPYYRNWFGYTCFMRGMQLPPLQVHDREWQAKGGLINERNDNMRKGLTEYIHMKVKGDPELVRKLTPTFAPLVRRLVVDNGFYDALMRDNVELVTEPIEKFTADGILTNDGKHRPFDLVVLACGFKPTEYLWPCNYVGRNGVTLDQTWAKDGARSYLGLTIPGYPNLYTLYGPNHQPRGGPSIHSFAEIWGRYAISSIVYMLENDRHSMEVRQSVFDEYNAKLDGAVSKLIWEEEGCGYFVNKFGRQAVNMPWTSENYHAMVLKPNLDDFDIM